MLTLPPHDLLTGASLMLDLDGTLVEIACRPDAIRVDERLQRLLAALVRQLADRVAIISGRSAAQVRSFFPEVSLAIAGSHGIEIMWSDGRTATATEAKPSRVVLERVRQFEAEHPGVLAEVKPFGIAIHYRLAPAAANDCRLFATEIAEETGYTLQAGKMVLELKIASNDKGDAVNVLMRSPPMRGTRPVFIGDDETDEAGFRMARQLGGVGVLVGPLRPSSAIYRLDTVEDTLRWLELAGGVAA